MLEILLALLILLIALIAIFSVYSVIWLWVTKVPPVPTSKKVARKMIELANLHPGQKIYDLGCGKGNILFAIALNGVSCTGYELLRPAVWFCRIKNKLLRRNIQFRKADFFQADLSDADVIFCYLWPSVMDRIYTEKWPSLKKGCKIVSHGFRIEALMPQKEVREGRAKIFVYEK